MTRILRESIDRFFDHNVHLESRTIYLGGDVKEEMTEYAVKALHLFDLQNQEPIKLLLSSEGGDWACALAIYDAINDCSSHVEAHVYGMAWSSMAIILQAADDRVLHKNATVMVHDGYEEEPNRRHARNVERWAKETAKQRQVMYDILAARSGKPSHYWTRKCSFDYIMSSHDAVKEKLADRVWQRENL